MPNAIGYARDKKLGSAKLRNLTQRAKELLSEARTYRETHRESQWRESERLYEGKHWTDISTGNDQITVNYAGSTVNTIIPFVAANSPQFRVEPYGGEATIAKAREQTAWLNRWWRSNDVDGNSELQEALWHYLVYGDGYLGAQWEMRTDKDPESAFYDKTTVKIEPVAISPWDIWIDRYERWVIRRVVISVEELKQDSRYHNTARLQAASEDYRDNRGVVQLPRATSHERDQLVDVYEFYDRVTDELLVFVDQLEVPLRFVQGIKFPIVQMGNFRIPNSPYHAGEMEQIKALQHELNKTRSQMVSHRRRNVQKFAVREGALDDSAITALKSETVNAVVSIKDRGADLDDMILPLAVPLLSPDAYNSYEIAKSDIFDITGVSEYLRGSVPSGRRTATEASIIEGSNNVKTQHKLRAVEAAVRQLGQLIIEIARDVFPLTTEDEVGMIVTGREAQALAASGAIQGVDPEQAGEVASARIDPGANEGEMWQGMYQVEVERASTELRDPFVREQKYRQLFTDILGALPVLQAQGINPDLRKLLELWFEAAGVEDFESVFGTALPPQRSPEQLSAIAQGGNALGGTAPGQPALDNIGAPLDQPTSANSGLLS